jgi:hypothetical protein
VNGNGRCGYLGSEAAKTVITLQKSISAKLSTIADDKNHIFIDTFEKLKQLFRNN